jgi:hypothetical protein
MLGCRAILQAGRQRETWIWSSKSGMALYGALASDQPKVCMSPIFFRFDAQCQRWRCKGPTYSGGRYR